MIEAIFSACFGVAWHLCFKALSRVRCTNLSRIGLDLFLCIFFPFSHYAICLIISDLCVKPYCWIFLVVGFLFSVFVYPIKFKKRKNRN